MPRMTIEFPKQVNEMLKDLAEKDQTTKLDVLRRALALYDYLHREAAEKNLKLSLTDDEDTIIKDILFE